MKINRFLGIVLSLVMATSIMPLADAFADETKIDTIAVKTEEWINPFTDVKEDDSFYDAVRFVNTNGIMDGMAEDKFVPDGDITRGMLVTVLYRMEGSPEAKECTFDDVKPNAYYNKAVAWANENNIVKGVSEKLFNPDDNITREQTATVLYRYVQSKYPEEAFDGAMGMAGYEDVDDISDYADEAMRYTVVTGIIKGDGAKLGPKTDITRKEVALAMKGLSDRLSMIANN